VPELTDRLQAALGSGYRVEKELGGGGMSRVFLAEEVRLGRKVVVKVLPPEMSMGVSVDRFEREIQLAAKLQHPHIVPLLTAGSSDDLLYYVMPFIEGESLRAKLGREGELPVPEALRILRDVLDALAYEALWLGFPLLTLGIILGLLQAQQLWGAYWIWGTKETWSLLTWLIYGLLLLARLNAGMRGRKAAILSIVGFGAVLVTFLGVSLMAPPRLN